MQNDGLSFSKGDFFKIPSLSLSVRAFSLEFYLKQPSLPGEYQTVLESQDRNFSVEVLSSVNGTNVRVSVTGKSLEATVV